MFSPQKIEERVQAAIEPQLDQLEDLFDEVAPRVIGKHHPEYETLAGKIHHFERRHMPHLN